MKNKAFLLIMTGILSLSLSSCNDTGNEIIDETEAQTLLNEVKTEICNVLRSEGA